MKSGAGCDIIESFYVSFNLPITYTDRGIICNRGKTPEGGAQT
jgi:hypothetical protein